MSQSVIAIPPHGTHVYINNRFRDPSSPGAYSFRVPQFSNINPNVRSYLAVVKSVVTKNNINTITAGQNDAIQYKINGLLYEVILGQGVYTIDSLLAALNVAIQAVNPGFVWSYDTIARRVSLVVPAATTFSFVRPVLGSASYISDRQDWSSKHDRFLNMIGMIKNATSTYTGATTIVAQDPADISGTNWMDVNFDFNLNVMHSNPNNPQTFTSVPVDVPFGQTIVFEPPTPRTFVISPAILEYVYIFVTDEWGKPVVVPDNTPLQIHLLLIPQ